MTPCRLRTLWNCFFFKPVDPRPIALFRIFFGSLLIINAMLLWPDLMTWYGRKGVVSIETARAFSELTRLNLLNLFPSSDSWIRGFFLFHLLAAVSLTLGLFTRASAIAVFLTTVSLHHRNVFMLNSGDTFLRVVSFLLIFSRAGAYFSLDWAWKVIKGEQSANPVPVVPWAQRMIQLQLSLLYLVTVIAKLHGHSWWDGTAVYYASRLEDFHRFPVPWIFENLILIKLLTWSTLAIELSMATLVWVPRFRSYALLSALLLHLGIEYSMNIPLFEWLMISTLILFVDPNWMRRWVRNLRRATGKESRMAVTLFYDGDCAFCVRVQKLLHCLDALGRLRFTNFRETSEIAAYPGFDLTRAERELMLRTRFGKWLYGYAAFRHIAGQVPAFWPLVWLMYLPGISFAGRKTYAWVATHRYLFFKQEGPQKMDLPSSIPSNDCY